MFYKVISVLLLLIITNSNFSQTPYPTDYFRSPIDGSITLIGNFGEIRPNHFHSGFDISTKGKEGITVYSIADGYVSRIKVSANGYGKALYITHPNGYTSVYGHLKKFNDAINLYVKAIQYATESFEIDTLLTPTNIIIKKGELIALSGNSGASEGPHLHFEIRDTKTEEPVNPYYFGYKISDTNKPVINQVVLYPMDDASTINGFNNVKKIKVSSKKANYLLSKPDSITVNGNIGFGIECWDTESNSINRNAVFSIELQVDDKRIYFQHIEKFKFDNSRYVNAHIDYAENIKHKVKIQKCFVSKNNLSEIYSDVKNNGIINFNDNTAHKIKCIVKDYVGNTSTVTLLVHSLSLVKPTKNIQTSAMLLDCLKENKVENESLKIVIPSLALYDDIIYKYDKSISLKGLYSPIHQIFTNETPLQKSYSLSIKPVNLPVLLSDKSCIISLSPNGKRHYEGGVYNGNWVSTETKTFGNFAITVDTIAPVIKLKNKNKSDFKNVKTISFSVTDNLSGIKKYVATLDDKWILCEYDEKNNLLFYTFDEIETTGKHTFYLKVTDDKNNVSSWKQEIIR